VLVELKTRWANRTFPSDVIQLSAEKVAREEQTRQAIARYGVCDGPGPNLADRAQIASRRTDVEG
jgi:hypothetical protein